MVQELISRDIKIDMAIIGEPSSNETIGDYIKTGRRGSLGGELTIIGMQGHVAYPHQSLNPIHESLGALKDLVDMKWDDGTPDFGPTTFQISNINAGTGARNVVPGFKKVIFNFRYSPASTEESLKSRVKTILESHSLNYEIDWHEVCHDSRDQFWYYLLATYASSISIHLFHPIKVCSPYETDSGSLLVKHALESVEKVTGRCGKLSTSGGTSDGRFLRATGAHVIELGLSYKTIHKINEHVRISELEALSAIYKDLLERILLVD